MYWHSSTPVTLLECCDIHFGLNISRNHVSSIGSSIIPKGNDGLAGSEQFMVRENCQWTLW